MLIIAFALFALLIATWIAAPSAPSTRRNPRDAPASLPAIAPRSVRA
jgi:hypothetical protein